MKNYFLTLCTVCVFPTNLIEVKLPLVKAKAAKSIVVDEETPDIVSVPANIEDYYTYDKKSNKWVWSGE